jgi:hypothetical protein
VGEGGVLVTGKVGGFEDALVLFGGQFCGYVRVCHGSKGHFFVATGCAIRVDR